MRKKATSTRKPSHNPAAARALQVSADELTAEQLGRLAVHTLDEQASKVDFAGAIVDGFVTRVETGDHPTAANMRELGKYLDGIFCALSNAAKGHDPDGLDLTADELAALDGGAR